MSEQLTPPEVVEAANNVSKNLLPDKSSQKYMAVYNKFIGWKSAKNTESFSENVLLAYFSELATTFKPSSLWSMYSMLKSTLLTNHNVDLKKYSKLTAFLKKQNVGFKSKKSKILNSDEVEKFLNEAPDDIYLATKVALIVGITGACRRDELCNITIEDIKEHNESLIVITLPKTKTHISRSFTITDKFYHVIKKYMLLRPENCKTNRLFINYQRGKCYQQPIGIHKFGTMPKQIATFLKLPEPNLYTGHTFRRTSATLLVEAGADLTTLKRHGGWKSNTVAESYVEDSLNNKKKICNQIGKFINLHDQSNVNLNIESNINSNIESNINLDDELNIHFDTESNLNFNHEMNIDNLNHESNNFNAELQSVLSTKSKKIEFIGNESEVLYPGILQQSSSLHPTMTENMKLPIGNFNLTINNSTNVTININSK